MRSRSMGFRVFSVVNHIVVISAGLLCVLPLVHMFSVSLSASGAANANEVGLWPVGINLLAYQNALQDMRFLRSLLVTLFRVGLGTAISMVVMFLMAYPLSKDRRVFPLRNAYIWIIVFTMLFSGGLIPSFMLVNRLHLMDTIWALVLPTAVNAFFVMLIVGFFRELPREIEESAFLDGASHLTVLSRIFIPLSLPIVATIALFTIVGHWNAWFDGIIYMNDVKKYPLQTYLQILLQRSKQGAISFEEARAAALFASKRSIYVAEMFLAMVPIMIVYPSLQRYFATGIIVGSVKG